nr:translation initiation factor IF-3 [Falsarthrobacter nasiphocae]
MNDRIRVPEVRLVGPNGEQVGVVRIEDALRLAAEADLDLVEVAPQAKPPVCKLMDYGKFKYEAAVKARESRKNQTNTVLKEVRFRLKIDSHDYDTKTGHARRFLEAGDKVKAMIQFRGREQQRPELGIRLLEKFAADVAEFGAVESAPRIDGRNMVMVVGPLKNKAEAKAAARRSQAPEEPGAPTRRQQRSSRMERVDTQKVPSSGQSLADAMPEGLKQMASQAAGTDQAPAPEAPSTPQFGIRTEAQKAADAKAAAERAAASRPASKAPSSKAPARSSAPRSASGGRPASGSGERRPSSSAPSGEARRTPPAAAGERRPAPARTPSAKPPVARPAAAPKPASDSSAGTGKPATPAPRPAGAPKPAATPKPAPVPKPMGQPKPGAGRPASS